MLEALQAGVLLSERKSRLFAAACCRRIWPSLNDRRSRSAVEMAERFADGMATEEELGEAEGDAWDAAGGEASGSKREAAAWAASDPEAAAWNAPEAAASAARDPAAEWAAQCDLLRDIFFNPFRPPPSIAPSVLRWHGGTVKRLAEEAYQELLLPSGHLGPQRLAVLADALDPFSAPFSVMDT
jgi:hypothetical protein